jgi:histidyl-tRNA synthetase
LRQQVKTWRSRVVERLKAVRGMNDVLPEQSFAWRHIEHVFSQCLSLYGYQEIRLPIVESTQLFKRSIGEVTDIVEKEMYTFVDMNGDSITLRPEGTAGCLRACLEHGLLYNQQQKLWYCGPMFRHEKPQKGRYRQFTQLGVEALGIAGIGIELELIALCKRLWNALGIIDAVELQVNTIGSLAERQMYRQVLIDYFTPHFEYLDEDSKRRLHKNPLRILDSKNPQMQALISNAPKLIDTISDESRQYFLDLCQGLDKLAISYQINPTLVRGLDYYGHTVFEWVTNKLGSQSTVCAGGRFDALVGQLGGDETPAVGFAMGVERLLLLMETLSVNLTFEPLLDVFIIVAGDEAMHTGLCIAESLREQYKLKVLVNVSGGSFKSQFKKADKSRARLAIIIGEEELQQQKLGIKDLRNVSEQMSVPQDNVNEFVKAYLKLNVS